MSEEKKYPKVVVGVFIFNDKSELFLMAHRYWQNKFTIPGGHVEIGEKFEETVKREVKEETNLDIKDIEFLDFENMNNLKTKFTGPVNHLVSFLYKVRAKGDQKVILNKEGSSFKWQTVEEWLKQKEEVTDSSVEPMIKYFINNNQI
ncbi:MAG: NUDIX hydrolase [Patescibacteria group bacterium]|jgi:nucleoside triphosphatase